MSDLLYKHIFWTLLLQIGRQRIDFTYGADDMRVKTIQNNNGNILTKYFALGDYEEELDHATNTTTKYYYIMGGDGLAAIYKQTGTAVGIMYYVHKDILGSIDLLTTKVNNTAQVAERYAYDAWGNRRNPVDWTQPDLRTAWIIVRGYIGQEHLDIFGLINLNGRMYEPRTARFLSADDFVQSPDFSQSYNRYAYCVNNPLKYTDSNGECWNLVIGAVIGGVLNWAMNGAEFTWKGLFSFGIGAVSGIIGGGIGSLVSPVGGTLGFFSGALQGGIAGFSSGFIGGAFNSWLNGSNFGNGLLNGLIEGSAGMLIGATFNGISSGIKARKLDLPFGSGIGDFTTDFQVSEIGIIGGGDPTGITNGSGIESFADQGFPGNEEYVDLYSYGFDANGGKSPRIDYSMHGDWIIRNNNLDYGVAGFGYYIKETTFGGLKTKIFISPAIAKYANDLTATLGHEITHAYHLYSGFTSKYGTNWSEYYAYSYSASVPHNYHSSAWKSALNYYNVMSKPPMNIQNIYPPFITPPSFIY